MDKTEDSSKTLEMMYEKEEAVIRNLLTLKNASYQKVYADNKDFAETYPFIPFW